MPTLTCDYCPKEVGNEGAKAQHERACEHNPANQQTQTQPAPQTQQQQPQTMDARSAGGSLADLLIAATDDDLPADARAGALRGGLKLVGDAFVRYQEYRTKKNALLDDHARSVDLGDPDELPYPVCGECDYQFDGDDIPMNAETVRCPSCDKLYPIEDREPPVEA